jgi:glutamine synthetase
VPQRLAEAAALLEGSAFARDVFGADVVEHYLHFTRTEERAIAERVSDVERLRYFERI